MGELESRGHGDPARLRISDADRHRVADLLRDAAGEGRIDLTELDERLEATYSARTYADLVPITVDLPDPGATPPAVPRPAASPDLVPGAEVQRHFAVMSGVDRGGVWTVPEHLVVFALMGGANFDLRQATFAAAEVVITVNAFMGGATIVVGPHVNVVIEGIGIMGGYSGPSGLVEAKLDNNSPTVRIRGVAIWGGVSVERKHAPRVRQIEG